MRTVSIVILVILGTLVLSAGLAYVAARPKKPIEDVKNACVQHTGLGMHIHPKLRIIMHGEEQKIPAHIGIVNNRCMRPIHTHDDTGVLHLEFPAHQNVRLRAFFEIWEQPLSRTHILTYAIKPDEEIVVTVNGEQTDQLEDLLLHDGDNIVMTVRKKEGAMPSPRLPGA